MKEKLILYLKILIILAIIALIALVYCHQGDFASIDLGRHLMNGKMVWSQPGVLFKNFYSYTEPAFPFINHHWLAGVIFWLLYLSAGFKILTLLNILLGVGAVLIVFKLTVRKSNFWLAAILGLPVILLMSERVDIRPEMFSYLLIGLTYYLVEDFRARGFSKKLIWLAPMFLVWVNLHIYFFIGLFLISLAVLEQLIIYNKNFFKIESAKKFLFVALAVLAATLLNPNFIKGLLYPFNILKKYGYDIVENKSPFYLETLMIDYNILIFKILLGLLILSFILLFTIKRRKVNFYNLTLALVFSVFACLYIRNLPMFGLIILPIMAENFYQAGETFKNKLEKYNIYILGLVFLIYCLALGMLITDNKIDNKFFNKSLGLGMSKNSLESIKFYEANNLSGPIFNNYDLGSALIFWLYPKEHVFVDNRPEAYSIDFFQNIYKPMMSDSASWQKYTEQYKINLIYISHTDGTPWARQFIEARLKDQNWPLIYFDDYTLIMIKNSQANNELVAKYKIDGAKFMLRINELLPGASDNEKINLADLSQLNNQPSLAENIYIKMLERTPSSGKIQAMLGFLYSGGNSTPEIIKAIEYLQKAIDNGYNLPSIYNQFGLEYWNLSDYSGAKNMWQKALKIDSNNVTAKYYLNQANGLIK